MKINRQRAGSSQVRLYRSILRMLCIVVALGAPGLRAAEVISDPASSEDQLRMAAKQAFLALSQGDFKRAQKPAEKAAQLSAAKYGEQHWKTIDALVVSGVCVTGANLEGESLERFASAWELYGSISSLYRQSQDSIGPNSTDARLDALDSRVKQAMATLAELHPDGLVLRASLNLKWAAVQFHKGHYDGALSAVKLANEAFASANLGDYPGRVRANELTGLIYEKLGQLKLAETRLKEAFEQSARTLGPQHRQTLQVASHLAHVLSRLGRSSATIELLQTTLRLTRQQFGDQHVETLKCVLFAGNQLSQHGQPVRGEKLIRHVLGSDVSLPDFQRKLFHASARSTLGSCLRRQGRIDEAAESFRATYLSLKDLLGENHRSTQTSLFNWALMLKLQHQHEAALKQIKALDEAFDRSNRAETDPLLLQVKAEKLELSQRLGHAADASEYHDLLRRLVVRQTQNLGETHPDTLLTLCRMASFLSNHDRPAAIKMLRDAEAAATPALPSTDPAMIRMRRQLGELLYLDGQWSNAIEPLALASRAFEDTRRARGFEGLDSVSAHGVNRHLPLLAITSAKVGHPGEAWRWLEANKARRLWDELHRALPQKIAASSASEEVQSGTTHETIAAEPHSDPLRPMTLEEIQRQLEPDAAFVAWVGVSWPTQGHTETWACVVRNTGAPRWIEISTAGAEGAFDDAQLRKHLIKMPTGSSDRVDFSRLRRRFIEPVLPLLRMEDQRPAIRKLVVLFPTPQGLPVELLAPEYVVSYAPSASVYAHLRAKQLVAAEPKLLAVGDPDYLQSASVAAQREGRQPEQFVSKLPGTAAELESLAELFGDGATLLEGARANEQEVQRRASAGELKEYRWIHFATHGAPNAIEPFRSSLLLADYQRPVSVDEALAAQPLRDGELTARQILETWRIDAELVTLSACQTAIGPRIVGEHCLGFSQALTTAGAQSVVVSLWAVRDDSTALLMRRFYQNLLGKRRGLDAPLPKAEALHEAKQWLRNLTNNELDQLAVKVSTRLRSSIRRRSSALPEKELRPFQHPYYWAPFILIGDSR